MPPAGTPIPAANNRKVSATTEGSVPGKIFAATTVIGLVVASSAAFVAKHPSAVTACVVGVLAKPLPPAGCN